MPDAPIPRSPASSHGQVGLFNCLLMLAWIGFGLFGMTAIGLRVIESRREAAAPDRIRAVLAAQETAWNAHDLDGFMAGYWKSDELKFLSGDEITTGWQPTYDRFHAKYIAGDKTKMGHLKFEILDVDVIGADAAIVRGKWGLVKPDGTTPHGLFTLLFRRIDGEWKIVSDHTSVAEKK